MIHDTVTTFKRKQRDELEQRARDVRVIKYPGYIDYTVYSNKN